MNCKELIIGRAYYTVFFAECDLELSIPLIDTLIYLGRDIEDKNTWVFQDAESYINHGIYLDIENTEEEINVHVHVLSDHDLEDIITTEDLIKLLALQTRKTEP